MLQRTLKVVWTQRGPPRAPARREKLRCYKVTLKGARDQLRPAVAPRASRETAMLQRTLKGRGPNEARRVRPPRRCSSHLGAPIGAGGLVLTFLLIATP